MDAVTTAAGAADDVSAGAKKASNLRRLLVAGDMFCSAVAWAMAFSVGSWGASWQMVVSVIGLTVVFPVLARSQSLYKARVCAVRPVEIARLARCSALSGVAAVALAQGTGTHLRTRWAVAGVAVQFVALVAFRGAFGQWLSIRRVAGRFARKVVIVGDNDEAVAIHELLKTHRELGYEVVGWVGDPEALARRGVRSGWLCRIEELPGPLHGATGVIIAGSSLPPEALNRTIRLLTEARVHVQLSLGLTGISHRRLRPLPLMSEPLFYLERTAPTRAQLLVKRIMDLVIGTLLLVMASPVLALAALAIWLADRGPVLYRQTRVGQYGRPFSVLKLRTMVVDAEGQLEALRQRNGRSGPLFKLAADPRVTRVGRLLRATSIDELPQLVNVLKGEMSLVGPRPALPAEVAEFDHDLLARDQVPPGLTGLWQVKARDNASFASYRRLDLFYIENRSILLDLTIIASTAGVVLLRAWQAVRARHRSGDPEAVDVVLD